MAGLMWVIMEAFESRTQNVQSQRSGHDSFYRRRADNETSEDGAEGHDLKVS